ncbi:MAG: AAA family ATPase [Candidatus Xenobiia bacterium LiM19]
MFLELSRNPDRLGALTDNRSAGTWIVIDEIQKIPQLLDEVHRLMKEREWQFALSGSSARKLRRGGVNLPGGRAVTCELAPSQML